ncbi:Uncharacterised protein [uncultured archaeon]|nr:Uncharacterised protein [uncultured archaeon]
MAIEKAKADDKLKEKKEDFLQKIEKPSQKSGGPPFYLIVMLVVLGVLIGVAAMMSLGPKTPSVPISPDLNTGINDTAYRVVPVTMVYSPDCVGCRQTNSIETLFKTRQVNYSLAKVDANSGEGKALISKYGITRVPTAIIDAGKMAFYPTTMAQFDEAARQGYLSFRKLKGEYVVPEYATENVFYPSYFLDKVTGICTGSKPNVVQFDDFYSPAFTKDRRDMYNFTKDFNSEVEIRFSYTQTQYSQDNNSALGNLMLMCASQQGKYLEMEHAMAGIYCNNPFKGDPTILTDVEIDGCWTLSDHYGKPLSQFELDVAAQRAGLDVNAFKECYANREVLYNNAAQSAKDLDIGRTGIFLIDCRETAMISGLKGALCKMDTGIKACSKPAIDANAGSAAADSNA